MHQLRRGVDQQQDGEDGQVLDLVADALHQRGQPQGKGHGDQQRDEDLEEEGNQGPRAESGVDHQEIEDQDAQDVREGTFVGQELTAGLRQKPRAGDGDGAADNGEGQRVNERGAQRHLEQAHEDRRDAGEAEQHSGQRRQRALLYQRGFFQLQFQVQPGLQHYEDEADGAQGRQDVIQVRDDVAGPVGSQAQPEPREYQQHHRRQLGPAREHVEKIGDQYK